MAPDPSRFPRAPRHESVSSRPTAACCTLTRVHVSAQRWARPSSARCVVRRLLRLARSSTLQETARGSSTRCTPPPHHRPCCWKHFVSAHRARCSNSRLLHHSPLQLLAGVVPEYSVADCSQRLIIFSGLRSLRDWRAQKSYQLNLVCFVGTCVSSRMRHRVSKVLLRMQTS